MPSHYLNRYLNIVYWTLRKNQWNLNRNSYIFIHENAFQDLVLKMAAIMSRPQYVKPSLPRYIIHCQPKFPCSVWIYLLVSGVLLARSIPVAISAPLTGRKTAWKITGWARIPCFTCEDVDGGYPIPRNSEIVQSWTNLPTFSVAPFSTILFFVLLQC